MKSRMALLCAFHIGVRVNRTRMARIERIDAMLFCFIRVIRILLTCYLAANAKC
jgi:hypothetical protein